MAQTIHPDIMKIIDAYLAVLRSHRMPFESVWLFGSFAQNRVQTDSDIDLALVMPKVKRKFFKEVELTRFRRKIDSRIEPHIINADDLDSPFYQEIVRHGVRIV